MCRSHRRRRHLPFLWRQQMRKKDAVMVLVAEDAQHDSREASAAALHPYHPEMLAFLLAKTHDQELAKTQFFGFLRNCFFIFHFKKYGNRILLLWLPNISLQKKITNQNTKHNSLFLQSDQIMFILQEKERRNILLHLWFKQKHESTMSVLDSVKAWTALLCDPSFIQQSWKMMRVTSSSKWNTWEDAEAIILSNWSVQAMQSSPWQKGKYTFLPSMPKLMSGFHQGQLNYAQVMMHCNLSIYKMHQLFCFCTRKTK